jgi:hypothetical protein
MRVSIAQAASKRALARAVRPAEVKTTLETATTTPVAVWAMSQASWRASWCTLPRSEKLRLNRNVKHANGF